MAYNIIQNIIQFIGNLIAIHLGLFTQILSLCSDQTMSIPKFSSSFQFGQSGTLFIFFTSCDINLIFSLIGQT